MLMSSGMGIAFPSRTPFSTPSSRKPCLSTCKTRIWLSRKCIVFSSPVGTSAPRCRSCRGFTHRRTTTSVTRSPVSIIFFRRSRGLKAGRVRGRRRRCTGFSGSTLGCSFSFGNLLLAKLISLIVGWITFPAVWLDYLLMRNRHAHISGISRIFHRQKTKRPNRSSD